MAGIHGELGGLKKEEKEWDTDWMGQGNAAGLPGSTNPFEVHDYEFKVRPISTAVFFSSYSKMYWNRHEQESWI